MQTAPHIDRLCETLGLTPYQSEYLKSNIEKYSVHGMVKRDGVLYVPRRVHGFWGGVVHLLRGTTVDQIGRDGIVAPGAYENTPVGDAQKSH